LLTLRDASGITDACGLWGALIGTPAIAISSMRRQTISVNVQL
jgi:hypothetical protein